MLTEKPDRICFLNLDHSFAALTSNAENMSRDLGETALLDRNARCRHARISENSVPVFRRHIALGTNLACGDGRLGPLFNLFRRWHPPTGRSLAHASLEHNKNKRVESPMRLFPSDGHLGR